MAETETFMPSADKEDDKTVATQPATQAETKAEEVKPADKPADSQPAEQPADDNKQTIPATPLTPADPPHENLYGNVEGVVKYKDYEGWHEARWQPPYPTPTDISDYIVKSGDQMWRIANSHHVPNSWIRKCNAIPYSRQNYLRPGTRLKMTYTPSRRDFFID